MQRKKTATASKQQRKAGERPKSNIKRKVERHAHVPAKSGRKKNVPKDMQPVDHMLWEQHAICEQNKPPIIILPFELEIGGREFILKVPGGFCDPVACAGGLLFRPVRKSMGGSAEEAPESTHLRVYTPVKRQSNRIGDRAAKLFGCVDSVVRYWWGLLRKHPAREG